MLLQAVVLCHLASDQCVLAFYVTFEPWTPSQLDPWQTYAKKTCRPTLWASEVDIICCE